MFNRILFDLLNQREDYLKLKDQVDHTPLKKSVEFIIEQINKNIEKISILNKI